MKFVLPVAALLIAATSARQLLARSLLEATSFPQIGQNITNPDDFEGNNVAINYDGTVIVTVNGDVCEGNVRTFRLDAAGQSVQWKQFGQTFQGEPCDSTGKGLGLNKAGTRMGIGTAGKDEARGSVSVYEYAVASDRWEQMGTTIYGEIDGLLGTRVELNAEGNIMAVSEPHLKNFEGAVYIYMWNATALDWFQLGQTLSPPLATRSLFGSGLSLDNAGTNILVGGRLEHYTYGQATMFDLVDGEWVTGVEEHGEETYDRFGVDVEMTGDGNSFIVGAYTADAPEYNEGIVYVYHRDASGWAQVGSYNGSGIGDKLGSSVAISKDARVLVWSSPEYDIRDSNGTKTKPNVGRVQILRASPNDPTKFDPIVNIDGSDRDEFLGQVMALSGDGNRIVIGSHGIDSPNTGRTFVLDLSAAQPGVTPAPTPGGESASPTSASPTRVGESSSPTPASPTPASPTPGGESPSVSSTLTPRFTALGLFLALAYFNFAL